MRVKDYFAVTYDKVKVLYLVVNERYWNRYSLNAYVDRVCYSLEEAKCISSSIERCDGISTVILKVVGNKIVS